VPGRATLARLARPDDPNFNKLLASLPDREFELLRPELEPVRLDLGQILYEPGQQMQHAYFPTDAVVSLYYVTRNGAAAASADVGNEGVVGVTLCLGGDSTSSSAVVLSAGRAWRLERRALTRAFETPGLLQGLLLRYTQALITQVAQTAVCNRHHSVEQQLSRWLLQTLDRAQSPDLVMTQELVANMLGVRRETVTETAGKLQQRGYIRYRRGHILVTDRAGLESCACECYVVVKNEQDRLLCDRRYRQEGLPAH
jgi:CRP-like cAMP-binding protein